MENRVLEIQTNNFDEIDYKFIRTEREEIEQNITNIASRTKNNVVLARHKGLGEHVDKPSQIAAAETQAEIIEEIERDEDRYVIDEIEVSQSEILQGKMTLRIKGEVRSG